LFDISLGKTTKLFKDVPTLSVIHTASYKDIELDPSAVTVYFTKPSVEIDLGAFLKGFAGDLVYKTLNKNGAKNAMIDLGGNITILGDRKFNVGIANPNGGEPLLGISPPNGWSAVTSGLYQRYTIIEGEKYGHIIDPVTFAPVSDNVVKSVTVVEGVGTRADALSTALFVLAERDGLDAAKKYFEGYVGVSSGAYAIFALPDGTTVRVDNTSYDSDIIPDNTKIPDNGAVYL
ncbi:MAG: FAD:protein FMN transferase, partial [Oscillospiraceae bacterium]|nr:FAD:protein FMN transferase [Oscillospiraceae bacterium]